MSNQAKFLYPVMNQLPKSVIEIWRDITILTMPRSFERIEEEHQAVYRGSVIGIIWHDSLINGWRWEPNLDNLEGLKLYQTGRPKRFTGRWEQTQ